MATAPAAAAAPDMTDDDNDAGGGAGAADTGDDMGQDEAADETVVCTITAKADGTYMVYAGDEPGEDEGDEGAGEDLAAAGSDEGGAGPTDEDQGEASGGAAPAEAAPEGKPAKSIGEALKFAMEDLQTHESGGEGSADDNFQAGFTGGSAASPARPMAQKY